MNNSVKKDKLHAHTIPSKLHNPPKLNKNIILCLQPNAQYNTLLITIVHYTK